MYSIYHMCRKKDKGNTSVGFIGLAVDFRKAISRQQSTPKNGLVKRAMEDYDDLIAYVVKTHATKREALNHAIELRPRNNIGWNIQRAGVNSATNVKRSDEHIEAMKKASSKKYWITFPDGKRKKITNLTQFCNDNNININKIKSNRGVNGYSAKLVKGQEFKSKTYIIETPDGEIIETNHLCLFCRENGLTKQKMYGLANGVGKTHKNYKCSIK